MINEITQDINLTEKADERVDGILRELELSIQWKRPILLFAVFESEYVRRDVQSDLDNRLFDIRQEAVHVTLSDRVNQDILQILDGRKQFKNSVFIFNCGNLNAENQRRFFEMLNQQRDHLMENRIKTLFWLTQSEIINLARLAPDFWGCRHMVIEFTESPITDHMLRRTLESTWQGTGEYDDQIEDTDEKIQFREALLTNLPDNTESKSIRANMLLTLGVLHWRKGDFEKALNLLDEATSLSVKIDNKWLEAECLNASALVYTSTGLVDQAIDAYKQAIRLLPDQIFAWNNLGNLCAKIGRNDEAIVTFSKAIECNPRDSVAWNGLGNVYKKIGYYDDSVNAYSKSIKYTPSYAQPWNGIGDVYALMGRVEEAIKAYEQSIHINKNYLEPLTGLGNLYLKQEQYREAVKAYQRALYADEKNKDLWNKLGLAQIGCNDLEAAKRSFRNAVQVDRTFGSSYSNLGYVYAIQKKYDQAIEFLLKSLEFLQDEKERSVAWNRLGDAYRNLNRYEDAMKAYKCADTKSGGEEEHAQRLSVPVEEVPPADTIEAKEVLASIEFSPSVDAGACQNLCPPVQPVSTTELETGRNCVEPPSWLKQRLNEDVSTNNDVKVGVTEEISKGEVMKNSPQIDEFLEAGMVAAGSDNAALKADAVAWNEIGNENFRSGNYSEAIIAYNKATQKDPGFGMPYANMGLISLLQERYSEAILLYEKSILNLTGNSDKAIAYNGLGNAYRGVGDYDNAVKSFRKAAELDPYSAGLQGQMDVFKSEESLRNPVFWIDLGIVFFDNCSFNEAITALCKAVELNPNDGHAYQILGKAYAYTGRYAEAVSAFTRSIDLMDNNKEKANSFNHLGNAYRKLNDYDKAIESFQKAVVLSDEGVDLATRARFSLLSNVYAEKA